MQTPRLLAGAFFFATIAAHDAVSIRPATLADIPAITRIYELAVEHGTASFELESPDEAKMARRMRALLEGGYPYIVAESEGDVRVMPLPGIIAPGRPIDSTWKIRSTSPRRISAPASGGNCSRR